ADPGGKGAEDECPGADGGQADTGSPGCLGIASDRVDVSPERSLLEEQRPSPKNNEDNGDHPGDARERADIGPVDVAHGNHDDPDYRNQSDLDDAEACGWGNQAAAAPAGV